ncbi:hypothetical protein VSR82_13965 [Burkholderia sp. JPY481]
MDVMDSFVLASSLSARRREMLLAPSLIRTLVWPRKHAIECISPGAYAELKQAILVSTKSQRTVACPLLLKMLEAYLATTGQALAFTNNRFKSIDILVGFVGALYSDKFLYANLLTRYRWVHAWRATLALAYRPAYLCIPPPSSTTISEWFDDARLAFEKLELRPEQVDLWRGWPVPKLDQRIAWPDLRKIYLRYGKDFAEAFAVALGGYAAGRQISSLGTEVVFSDFIANLPDEWEKNDFLSHLKLTSLLTNFLIFLADKHGCAEHQFSTLLRLWNEFVRFAASFLCTGGFFAKLSRNDFPALPSHCSDHPRTHRRTNSNGETYITKLLIDIPLHLSHEDATELIYFKIQAHLESVKGWAESEVNALWSRFQRRRQLAKVGEVKMVLSPQFSDGRSALIDRQNPDWEAHTCATFEFHGFHGRCDGRNRTLYPHPLEDIASDILALPVAGALIPHLTLLVIEHPQLTPGFFENLRLYDKDNQLSGLVETDTGWLLDGDKFRRGPENSEQKIHLSERSQIILAQVLALTQPLRDYLRTKNDPNWRYLFLDCGKGFSNPTRMRVSHTIYRLRTSGNLKARFIAIGKMPKVHAEALGARFSLGTLRATAGVVAYIKEPDLQKLARLLGHKELDIRLLERYIPAPLMRYFEERWVRLFQCGILVEALKGSKYLLPSVGFRSLHDLNQFISHHALRWAERPGLIEEGKTGRLFDSVVFVINEEILTVLIGVQVAVANAQREVSKLAVMWNGYAEKLFAYIEHSSPRRDDFRIMLATARKRDCSGLISPEAIYA